MSDIPKDYRDQLDLRAIIAKIDADRANAEKLRAETKKFGREPWMVLSPACRTLSTR